MKKILLTTVATLAAVSMYAQGTVTFANNSAAAISNSITGVRVLGGTTFRVALYYLADSANPPTTADFTERGLNLLPDGVFLGTSANPSGLFNLGTRSAPTSPAGGAGWFQVRAWEAAYGLTYEAAINAPATGGRQALVGTSNIIKVNLGNPTTTPPGTAGSLTASGLQGFYVVPVPEPTTIGLGLLGLGALLALRRRK
jgi:MYXO-CTERM domain-containing protein